MAIAIVLALKVAGNWLSDCRRDVIRDTIDIIYHTGFLHAHC